MTQEDKQLLLVDICARLPYGVKVKCPSDDEPYTLLAINWNKEIVVIGFMMDGVYVTSKQRLEDIKPYLRPMSSMTEEERKELKKLMNCDCVTDYSLEYTVGGQVDYDDFLVYYEESSKLIDWLNKNMFDYRGLIMKGLAISTEEFNPYV